jgi:hypothetical protein
MSDAIAIRMMRSSRGGKLEPGTRGTRNHRRDSYEGQLKIHPEGEISLTHYVTPPTSTHALRLFPLEARQSPAGVPVPWPGSMPGSVRSSPAKPVPVDFSAACGLPAAVRPDRVRLVLRPSRRSAPRRGQK